MQCEHSEPSQNRLPFTVILRFFFCLIVTLLPILPIPTLARVHFAEDLTRKWHRFLYSSPWTKENLPGFQAGFFFLAPGKFHSWSGCSLTSCLFFSRRISILSWHKFSALYSILHRHQGKDRKLKTCSNSQVYVVVSGLPNNLLAFLFYLQT